MSPKRYISMAVLLGSFSALIAVEPAMAQSSRVLARASSGAGKNPAPTQPSGQNPADSGEEPEDASVGAIRNRYWARGEQADVGVVQNRIYSKDGKFELGVFGGLIFSDPFLSVKSAGGSLGYHFNEYFSLHAFGWRSFASASSALITFQNTRGATTNTNEPRSFLGAEIGASILYGKLSLLGSSILYYDFHLLGGAGVTDTETGRYVTPILGLGQQTYITQDLALRLDYRLMPYSEDIKEKVISNRIGEVVDNRVNWSSSVTLGLTLLLGGSSK